MTRRSRWTWLLFVFVATGCAQIEKEGEVVDDLIFRMHGDDFMERQEATMELLGRDNGSLRYIVIPRLALESSSTALEISSVDGNKVRGRVTGGDGRSLELVVTGNVAPGSRVSFMFTQIKVIRLFSP